jgi:hypothetical protein
MRHIKSFTEFLKEEHYVQNAVDSSDKSPISPTMAEFVIEANKNVSNMSQEDIDAKMKEANDLFGGHGVEGLSAEGAFVDKYYYNIIALYVNMGDTYDATILFDTENGEFLNQSWGDFYEKWMSENKENAQVD